MIMVALVIFWLRRRKRTANGGQVSTRRHVCRWCPIFRLGFRFLPHVPTTLRTSAPLLHHPFSAVPSSTLHHIHNPLPPHPPPMNTSSSTLQHIHIPLPPHPPPMNTSVTDDIFVAAILAAICSAFSALAPIFRTWILVGVGIGKFFFDYVFKTFSGCMLASGWLPVSLRICTGWNVMMC